MSDLVATTQSGGALETQMKYAQALAAASLIPKQYQRQPANILVAMEYGRSLGLDPVTAMQMVHVVEGKPAASAQLIGALVRRAGHRLRVTGDATRAVAEIIRKDDPDFVFRSEWTIDRARAAGLAGKGTWKQYPDAMLKARAITEVARDACPEALSGVAYTPEELGADNHHAPAVSEPAPVDVTAWPQASAPAELPAPETPLHVDADTGEIVDGEIVDPSTVIAHDHEARRQYPATEAQIGYLSKLVVKKGFRDLEDFIETGAAASMLGHTVSINAGDDDNLRNGCASALIEHFKADLGIPDKPKAATDDDDAPHDPWGGDVASGKQVAKIRALFAELNIPADERPDLVLAITNRAVPRLEQATSEEASRLIDHLIAMKG